LALSKQNTVSIIVPTLNRADLLLRCLQSISKDLSASSYKAEIIIVDGGCDKETLEVVTSFSNIVSTHIREKDSGVSDAVNKGLTYATSEWIRFLGDDDELVEGAMDHALQYCFLNHEIDVCIGHAQLFRQQGESIIPFEVKQPIGEILFHDMFDLGNCEDGGIGWPSPEVAISRRDLFVKHGGYCLKYHYLAYWEMWLRQLILGVKFHAIPCVMARRYLTERSDTLLGSKSAISKERFRLQWAYGGFSWLYNSSCKSSSGAIDTLRSLIRTTRLVIRAHTSS